MAITLVGILDSTEGTQTIAFAENITDRYFNHENMVNTSANENKLGNTSSSSKISINEYLYQRSYKPYFFTCGTAADTAAKAITGASGWGLSSTDLVKIWPLVRVKFTNTNTVANPTLNINNTGAKPIYYGGSAISATNAGILKGIVTLMYNGTTSGSEYWDFISGDTTTFTSEVSASNNILHGSSSGSEITYAPYSSETADSTWVGSDGNGGKLYLGDVDPSKTNRLNLNGYLYAKKLYSDGTEVKVKQTAVSDPSADGNTTAFIATISQDTNGVITVTKKNLGTATINTAGAIKVGAVKNSAVTNASTDDTNTAKRYSVLIDSTGLAYTNVPWTDSDTTYSSGNEITIGTGNAINHDAKLGTAFASTTAATTISGWGGTGSFKVPVLGINQYGHVTSVSEATMSITLPDNKITSYNAPTYDTAHVSPTYQAVIAANVITTNMVYDTAINKLDYKIAGLTKEVIDDEATLSQAIEDEPRYYAKSSTAAGTATKIATLVESRNYNLINGTKVTVYFSTANTANNPILVNVNNTGAKVLIYNDDIFDGSLIENGTTLEMVYDDDVNFVVGESPNTTTYTECYRVVGGVGSGGGSGSDTWRNVKVNNTQILGTGTNTSALNFVNGTGISISGGSNGNVTISATGGGGGVEHMGVYYFVDTNVNNIYRPFEALCDLFGNIYNDGKTNDIHAYVDAVIREYPGAFGNDGHIPLGAVILLYGMYLIQINSSTGRFIYESNGLGDYCNYIIADQESPEMWGDSGCTTYDLLTACNIFLVTANWTGALPLDINEYNAGTAGQCGTYSASGGGVTIPSVGGNANSPIWHKYTFDFANVAQGDLYSDPTALSTINSFISAIKSGDGQQAETIFGEYFKEEPDMSFFSNKITEGSVSGMLVTVHHESSVAYYAHKW